MTAEQKAAVRKNLLARVEEFDDLEAELLLTTWELWARPNQLHPEGNWVYWVALAGRGWGKTRVGGEWVRESVKTGRFEYVNLIGATVDDARDIMIEGESGILAICPRWERPEYIVSKRQLVWPNGCKSLIFTADEPERLRGKQHQRVWADEIAAWRYEESWAQMKFGLRLPPEPRAIVTTTPRPRSLVRDILERPRLVLTRGTTYENRENLAPEFYDEIISEYEGTRMGKQELLAELLLDEGLAYRITPGVHVIPRFEIPEHWQRFEAMDYGRNHPTAWPVFAVDYDGNIIVFDMYYSPGRVSEHAEAVLAKRSLWHHDDANPVCFGPPDIRNKLGVSDFKGREISVEMEFADHGIAFAPAQTDRRAGYQRIEEMLTCRDGRAFPNYHPFKDQPGSPRLFIFDTDALEPMVKQLRDAPLEDPDSPLSRFPGEAVDQAWESAHGHAHAALRYGLMSRPVASEEPQEYIEDDRKRALVEMIKTEQERDQWQDEYAGMYGEQSEYADPTNWR